MAPQRLYRLAQRRRRVVRRRLDGDNVARRVASVEGRRAAVAAHRFAAAPAVQHNILPRVQRAPRVLVDRTLRRLEHPVPPPHLRRVHVRKVHAAEVRVAVLAPHVRRHGPLALLAARHLTVALLAREACDQHVVRRQRGGPSGTHGRGPAAHGAEDGPHVDTAPRQRHDTAGLGQRGQAGVAVRVRARRQHAWHRGPRMPERPPARVALQHRPALSPPAFLHWEKRGEGCGCGGSGGALKGGGGGRVCERVTRHAGSWGRAGGGGRGGKQRCFAVLCYTHICTDNMRVCVCHVSCMVFKQCGIRGNRSQVRWSVRLFGVREPQGCLRTRREGCVQKHTKPQKGIRLRPPEQYEKARQKKTCVVRLGLQVTPLDSVVGYNTQIKGERGLWKERGGGGRRGARS